MKGILKANSEMYEQGIGFFTNDHLKTVTELQFVWVETPTASKYSIVMCITKYKMISEV